MALQTVNICINVYIILYKVNSCIYIYIYIYHTYLIVCYFLGTSHVRISVRVRYQQVPIQRPLGSKLDLSPRQCSGHQPSML